MVVTKRRRRGKLWPDSFVPVGREGRNARSPGHFSVGHVELAYYRTSIAHFIPSFLRREKELASHDLEGRGSRASAPSCNILNRAKPPGTDRRPFPGNRPAAQRRRGRRTASPPAQHNPGMLAKALTTSNRVARAFSFGVQRSRAASGVGRSAVVELVANPARGEPIQPGADGRVEWPDRGLTDFTRKDGVAE